MPFHRLISAVDEWAVGNQSIEIFGQIGSDPRPPAHFKWVNFVSPSEFRETIKSADLVVAHGGVGTLITAMQFSIPMLILPRQSELGETRCNHQFEICNKFSNMGAIEVAYNKYDLIKKLDSYDKIAPPLRIGPYASTTLLDTISDFIDGKEV